jgi:antitoxin YefM
MEETLYLLGTKANRDMLARSIADAKAGRVTERELIEP